jgi:hypothetical protein
MSTSGRPVIVTVPSTPTSSARAFPVSTPTNIPLETPKPAYLLSHDYKIEDIEGQCVKDWFKNDFGANNTFEFQAKIKSSAGRAKAKVTIDPTDKNNIKVVEDLEIQANIDYGVSALFKVRPKEVSAQFDFGLRPLSRNWFNPYVVFRLPRVGGLCKSAGSVGLGGVFHFDNWFNRRARHQFELGLGFGAPAETKNDITLRQNLSIWHRNFVFGLYESWNFTNGFSAETKLSGALHQGPARAYAQIDLNDKFRLANLAFGASYKVRPDLKFFIQTQKPISYPTVGKEGKVETPKETKDIVKANFLANVDLGAGVEYTHSSGLGLKLGYFHDKKVASVLSFNLNKSFSGSLLFDVGVG